MAMLGSASIRSRIATGPEAGEPWRRLGDRVDPVDEDEQGVEPRAAIPPRCDREGGMSLHADVAVPARDRERLERLCRYVARPPLALARLEVLTDGRLAYRLKTPWRDGTTHVVMERRELLERLAPLIPPPRAHQVRYHGVLAPCASARDHVVPAQRKEAEATRSALIGSESIARSNGVADGGGYGETLVIGACADMRPEQSQSLARRIAWADLLKRVFEVDALRCPACGERMRLTATITEPSVARRILECLGLSSRAPPLAPADEIDREPVVDPRAFERMLAGTQSDPGFDFDQSSVEGLSPGDKS
jgi:hypothetical protein